MRRPISSKHIIKPDVRHGSVRVEKFINTLMYDGKKEAARKVMYGALEEIKKSAKVEEPLEVFETAIQNVGPTVEVRSRRVGGANYQVPREVNPRRREALAIRWIIGAARSSRKGAPSAKFLAAEIIAASKNEGTAIKKREDVHRMAEANKAFAHFAW